MTTRQSINLPADSKILCAQVQYDSICIWYLFDKEVNKNIPKRVVQVFIHGTGHPVHEEAKTYIGTVQYDRGTLIFHVFTDER